DRSALGAWQLTMASARGLNTGIADAERIKAIYGSVLAGGSDERDMITVPPVEDDGREPPQFASRASLVRIIRPRVEEILEMVRDRLAASLSAAEPRGRVTAGRRRVDRRREPAHRTRRSRRAHLAAPRENWSSAWPGRFAGCGKGAGLCGGCRSACVPADGLSRTLRTAANAAIDDRNG